MNAIERKIRFHIIRTLLDTTVASDVATIAASLDLSPSHVDDALHSLAGQHRLVLLPGTDTLWMVHPFSAIATDFVVHSAGQRWYANCVWDGLSVLGIVGDGRLDTHSPQSGAPIRFDVRNRRVTGEGIVHFLVPARRFWDDIGFT